MRFLLLAIVFAFPLQAATLNLSTLVASSSGIDGEKNIEILKDDVVIIDRSVDVGELLINGKLVCSASGELKAKTITVNGTFECGTPTAPYQGKFYISLEHSEKVPKTNIGYRGLIVNNGGRLILAGLPARSGYYRLAKNAVAGEYSVTLPLDITGKWFPGDEVVIASSSYNPKEAETLKIKSINQNVVTFFSPLAYPHWGSVEHFQTQRGTVTLNEKAEIANLTRHIVIRPDESKGEVSDTDVEWGQLGGHVMVHKGGFANVDSVEFYKMGQAGIMARYPFHWHFAGEVAGQFIKRSSIHRSFQRCVTIHQTNSAVVHNNVCYSFRGHGFFLEDGNEINNTISSNLGILSRHPSPSRILLASDNSDSIKSGVVHRRFPAVSVFWISNPQNKVLNNVAAGSVGVGFWMSFVSIVRKFNQSTKEFDLEELARPQITNTLQYENNIAHSTLVGHTWDGAPVQKVFEGENPYAMNNPNNPMDRKIEAIHYAPKVTPVFKGLVAYKNRDAGIYFRGNTAVYENAILADNGWSMFLAYNQVIKNSLFVGRSQNHSSIDDEYLRVNYPQRQAGLILYDGPWEIDKVDFQKFPTAPQKITYGTEEREVTAVPMFTIGGANKFTNISRNVAFSPEPYHRAFMELDQVVSSVDETLANSIRDKDGSLTDLVNGILLPNNPFFSYSGCKTVSNNGFNTFFGFILCPPETQISTILFSADNAYRNIPYVTRRSDGAVSIPKADWDILDGIGNFVSTGLNHTKMILLNNPSYIYEVLMKPSALNEGEFVNLKMKITTEKMNTLLPVTKISGLGSNCRLENAPRYESMQAMSNATTAGYYSSGNDFYVRLKSDILFPTIVKGVYSEADEGTSAEFFIRCDSPVISGITGTVDEAKLLPDGSVQINGWACDYGQEKNIDVHVYVGGAAGQGGKVLGGVKAANTSTAAVNFLCGDASTLGHRYSYIVPKAVVDANPGMSVYVHGISVTGKSNLLLSNSGVVKLPGVRLIKYNCYENGVTIPHGTTLTRYKEAFVSSAETCLKELRTCNDGVLPGTYTQTSCQVNPNPVGAAMGYVDSITPSGSISGWACQKNNPRNIKVEIHSGNPATGSRILRTFFTNQTGEAAISQACGTTGLQHRFAVKLSEDERIANQGKEIHVVAVPSVTATPKVKLPNLSNNILQRFSVFGRVEQVVLSGTQVIISGWACDKGLSKQIDVHFYAGGPGGVGTIFGGTTANLTSEAGVATACDDPTMTPHRFRGVFLLSNLTSLRGKAVHAHGLSASGNPNLEIIDSGKFSLP